MRFKFLIYRSALFAAFLFPSFLSYGRFYKKSHADSLIITLKGQSGKERIHTLLHLADCYYYIQVDSAVLFALEAAKESEQIRYDWAFYKGKYFETKALSQNINNKVIQSRTKKLISWFENHGYSEDLILSKILYLDGMTNDRPIKEVENYVIKLLEEAKKLNNPIIEGQIWYYQYFIQQHGLFTNSNYEASLDSAINLLSQSGDSLWLMQLQIENIVQKKYKTYAILDSIRSEIIDELSAWNSRKLLYSIYLNVAMSYAIQHQLDSALAYCSKSMVLSTAYNSKVVEANVNYTLGYIYRINDMADKTIQPQEKSLAINKELGHLYNQYNVSKSLGVQHESIHDFQTAIKYYIGAIELAQQIENEPYINFTKASLANLYITTNEYEKAENLLKDVLHFVREEMTGRLKLKFTGRMHELLGLVALKEKNYDQALKRLDSSITYFIKSDYASTARVSRLKLSLFLDTDKVDSANSIYQFIITDKRTKRLPLPTSFSLLKGRLYFAQNKYQNAIKSLNTFVANSREVFQSEDKKLAHQLLFQAYEKLGNHRKALEHHVIFKSISDSISNANAIENVTLLQSKYELSEKEIELNKSKQEKEIQALKLSSQKAKIDRQQLNIFLLLLAIVLVMSWGMLFFNRYRLRQKNKQLLLQRDKETTAQQLELAELRSDFFTNISHEFRTPLTLIIGPLQQLQNQLSGPQQTIANRAYQNANHLSTLIDETLDLSRLENGHLPLNPKTVFLGNMVANFIKDFDEVIKEKNIDLNFVDRSEKTIVELDESMFKKIIINLLGNALKHTPDGGQIKVSVSTPDHKGIFIHVKDSGTGIAPEHLEYVFDRFYKADPKTKGSGVGLALSKQLVELHKGKLSVDSEPNKGSCFSLWLPLKQVNASILVSNQVTTVPKALNSAFNPIPEIKDKSILIIEDHDELRTYLIGLLEPEFEVMEADNGKTGIEIAEQKQPNLILSDIMMPFMDGLELTKHLKNYLPTSHIPIILITAKAAVDQRIEGLKTGADDYLGKPFHENELLERCKNLLLQREKLKDLYSSNYFVSPQSLTQNKIDQAFLKKALEIVEFNIEDLDFSVEIFAQEMAINRSGLHAKLKALTGKNTSGFIKSIRVKRAAQLLSKSAKSVSEVCDLCGFGSRETFNKTFKAHFGMTPTEFRKSEGPIPLE